MLAIGMVPLCEFLGGRSELHPKFIAQLQDGMRCKMEGGQFSELPYTQHTDCMGASSKRNFSVFLLEVFAHGQSGTE